jgi:hypothetical protein
VEELKVPTRAITVDIYTSDGAVRHGCMFHAETRYETGTAEDLACELNDQRAFLPLRSDDAETGNILLNKEHILRVHIPGLTADALLYDETDDGQPVAHCSVWLDDGSQLDGHPVVVTPGSRSRLLDKFNHAPEFLTFVSDDGVDFIHRSHVLRVQRHN